MAGPDITGPGASSGIRRRISGIPCVHLEPFAFTHPELHWQTRSTLRLGMHRDLQLVMLLLLLLHGSGLKPLQSTNPLQIILQKTKPLQFG